MAERHIARKTRPAPGLVRRVAPLRVLLITDGRPGHYRQSEGIVAALERGTPIALTHLKLGLRLPLPRGLVPKVARALPAELFLRLVHGIDRQSLERPDIIVSAGGVTLGANVALAQLWSVPNVFSGTTRRFAPSAFRLVLSPYASASEAANMVAAPKPTPFDPDSIPRPRPIRSPEDLDGARVSVLVGGPTPYADFGDGDWARLAALVRALATRRGCSVTVVTSPRTPETALQRMALLATQSQGAVSVIDFRSAGPGSIEAAFDCDLVLVTRDSMSMMTEAALSRRPAVALSPQEVRPHRDDEAVDALVAAGWLSVLPLADTDTDTLARTAAALTPIQVNHLDRLADLVLTATGLGSRLN